MGAITDTDAGLASGATEVYTSVELLSGDTPEIVTTNEAIASAVLTSGMAARTVVGLNGSGEIIKAVLGTTQAWGILIATIAAGSSSGTKAQIYRAGCFNPAALVWDATYDTDEKKRVAFNAAAGSQIFIKKSPQA